MGVISEQTGLEMFGLANTSSNNIKMAKEHYKALIELLHTLKGHLLRKDVIAYFQTLLSKQPVILVIQQVEILNKNKKTILANPSNWQAHKKWIDTCVSIQGEIMTAAQGIYSDQIPQETTHRLLNILNKHVEWSRQIETYFPNIIQDSLAYGVSNEAKTAWMELLIANSST